MKLFVCVKQVPDTSGKVAVNPDGTLNRASMQTVINPEDKNAVEAALAFKDRLNCRVIAVTMGPPAAEDMLRELMAMGVDEGYLITDRAFGGSDTYATSQIIAAAIDTVGLDGDDMIFCGRQAIDGDTAQVGPQIAEKLRIPQVTYAAAIAFDGGALTVRRLLEDGYMTVRVHTPCLISCTKELNTPRMMNVTDLYQAYDKPLTVLNYGALKGHPLLADGAVGLGGSPTNILTSFTPPGKSAGRIWENGDRAACEALAGMLLEKHII